MGGMPIPSELPGQQDPHREYRPNLLELYLFLRKAWSEDIWEQ
jgi:hypothetical protein